jgi:hypothetical protein
MKNLIEIYFQKKLLSIIIKSNFSNEGVSFFTPDNFSQQLECMSHPKGKLKANYYSDKKK